MDGFHRIIFSNVGIDDNFYGFPVDLRRHENYFRHPFVGEGNIVNGRLEGLWVIKPENTHKDSDDIKYHLTYIDGILQDSIRY